MKRPGILLLMAVFMISTVNLAAQKLTSGSLDALKGEKTLNVMFEYSNITVGNAANPFATGKGTPEKEYVDKKTSDLNAKNPGDGDRWAQAWKDDRSRLFQPAFLQAFNEKLEKQGVVGKENGSDAKYTLLVKTFFVDPGWNIGVSKKEAFISLLIDIVETADHSKVIASVEMKNVLKKVQVSYGDMTFDFAVGMRLQACYDQAGISFGKFLSKGLSK
jgi:hypothetical protein